jgi:Helix-turn-helix domain
MLEHEPGISGLRAQLRSSWNLIVVDQNKFFFRLGARIRKWRRKHGHSQEDMISFGFSARHWQQIEAGRPITVSTLLRICAVFKTSVAGLVRGLDNGIYGD